MNDSTNAESTPLPATYLSQPLPDLAAWTRYFHDTEIPILASTAQALEEMRANEDDVDAGHLSKVIQADPLMTLKLMAYVSGQRRPRLATEIESITSSLVMLGVAPFFRHFGPQPTLEERLRQQPRALQALRALLKRAERSGNFAVGFAVHRNDMDAGAIHLAAYLHDFAEMLLWCHAPTLALQIYDAQCADSTLRSATIQRQVLGITLDDLRQALMQLSHLPELLVRISDDQHADAPEVRNVVLAVRLARHTMEGWDNAALPDDIADIAQLLNAPEHITLAFLHKIEHSGE